MALAVTGIERSFQFKQNGQALSLIDPDIQYTPDEVLEYYTSLYPELQTATVKMSGREEGKLLYEFVTTVGTKG